MSIFKNYDEFFNAIINKKLDVAKKLFLEYPYDLTESECFIFREACYKTNLEIVQWLYFTSNQKINIRCLDDMPFLNACAGNKFDIVKWLYEIDPTININSRQETALVSACLSNNIEMVEWLHQKYDNFNYKYLYFPFRLMCNRGLVTIPKYLATKCNDFYVEIEDNQIKKWKVLSEYQRKLLDNNNFNQSSIMIEPCEICYEDNQYYVKFDCSHMYCRDCLQNEAIKKCPMCGKEINNLTVSLLKN